MAKRENLEMQETLRSAINTLLCENGYSATSYQAIADEAHVTRTIVQYYYPRKMDTAVEFLNRLLEACARALSIDKYAKKEMLTPIEAYEIGCLYYGFLFSTEGTRSLLFDILKDRSLADELMDLHCAWILERMNPDVGSNAMLSQDRIVALGGFYELMYQSLKYGRDFDIEQPLISLMNPFLESNQQLDAAMLAHVHAGDQLALIDKVEAALAAPAKPLSA